MQRVIINYPIGINCGAWHHLIGGQSVKAIQRSFLHFFITLLLITLLFPGLAVAQFTAQDEVREILSNDYVDPVKEEVLNAPTINAMLEKLGDPHTSFLTAAQYRDFNESLEQSFSGIGIYLDIVVEGVKVTGLVKGSPSEKAGLRAGDIITSVGSRSLKGLSPEEAIPLIRGPEGSKIRLLVLRDEASFSVLVERRNISVPSVIGEIQPFQIGYLRISSFGSETGKLFGISLEKLERQNPSSYIVDLRDNGGGYVTAALDIAGYFISDAVAMQTQHRNSFPSLDHANKHNFVVDKPTIYLINQNSASASEILAGAVKDYGQALIIGTQSYGKGSMQQLYVLNSGDYFKMTVAHFLSPLGHQINKVGITPDLLIEKSDPLKVAQLILSPTNSEGTQGDRDTEEPSPSINCVKFSLASHSILIDTRKARDQEYWQAYGEILDRVGLGLMKGTTGDWKPVNLQELIDRRSLYYTDYRLGNQLASVPVDKEFTIHFPRNVNWTTANLSTIELIASDSGERVQLTLTPLNSTEIHAIPKQNLHPSTCYWLVIHPTLQYEDNSSLEVGVVFTATVAP
jgi:carboxyl-terminal processing protease